MKWLFLLCFLPALAHAAPAISGQDLFSGEKREVRGGAKGLVVVFLSAVCPCSESHQEELSSLAKEFPEFAFVGVHANGDEERAPTRTYFEKAHFPFPLLRDGEAKLADQFRALKTPHAFVLKPDGTTAFQGGVSDSRKFSRAEKKYLRLALEDLRAGRAVQTPIARTLGCVISRGGKRDW